MKKYIKPAMKIAEIKNETILAGSGEGGFDNVNNQTGWNGNLGGFARDGRGYYDDDDF